MPRLRQVRIKNNTCYIPEPMKNYVSNCNQEYQFRLEETKHFAPNWKNLDEQDSIRDYADEIWIYKNWLESKTTSTIGM